MSNITGTTAGETLNGGAGSDLIDGLGGDDNLFGGFGNDTLIGGAGSDVLSGDNNVDTAVFAGLMSRYIVSIAGSVVLVADRQTGDTDTLSGIEQLRFDDRELGQTAQVSVGDFNPNTLTGGFGSDNMAGLGGGDVLIGHSGNDDLDGGAGNDTIFGGDGGDTARFAGTRTSYLVHQVGDVIVVSGPDGVDELHSVERLSFNGVIIEAPGPARDFDGFGYSQLVFRNIVDGTTFVRGADLLPLAHAIYTQPDLTLVGAAELQNQAHDELLYRDSSGDYFQSSGRFFNRSALNTHLGFDPASWDFAGAGNFDTDGVGDILLSRANGELALLTANVSGSPLAVFTQISAARAGTWSVVATADFDGDGRTDILSRESGGGDLLLRIGNAATTLTQPGSDWTVAGTGDLDGDGRADLVLRNATAGVAYAFIMNGSTISSQGIVGYADPAWQIKSVADFNGDGKADILYRNTDNGIVYLNTMDGLTQTGGGAVAYASLDWDLVRTDDFNGDGKADLLFQNHDNGVVYLQTMDGFTTTSAGAVAYGGTDWVLV